MLFSRTFLMVRLTPKGIPKLVAVMTETRHYLVYSAFIPLSYEADKPVSEYLGKPNSISCNRVRRVGF